MFQGAGKRVEVRNLVKQILAWVPGRPGIPVHHRLVYHDPVLSKHVREGPVDSLLFVCMNMLPVNSTPIPDPMEFSFDQIHEGA